jgi:O-antigen ligase
VLLGTFANRNSAGLFLVFVLALAAVLPAPRPHPAALYVRLSVGVLLLLGIVLTRSRTALVLAMLPLMLAGLRALWWWSRERSGGVRRGGLGGAMLAALGGLGLAAAGVAALVIAAPGQVGTTLERFEAKDDPRRFIWDDATYSVSRYWPAGAGMGTFDEVFQIDESLENLTKKRAGRAHNDYIELAIEAGPLGLALAAAWVVLIGWLSWHARRSSQRWTAWAGSTLLLAIALQSVTDYPLRNQAMLAFAGFALLLLARVVADSGRVRR